MSGSHSSPLNFLSLFVLCVRLCRRAFVVSFILLALSLIIPRCFSFAVSRIAVLASCIATAISSIAPLRSSVSINSLTLEDDS